MYIVLLVNVAQEASVITTTSTPGQLSPLGCDLDPAYPVEVLTGDDGEPGASRALRHLDLWHLDLFDAPRTSEASDTPTGPVSLLPAHTSTSRDQASIRGTRHTASR
jgi:hypothetical protein